MSRAEELLKWDMRIKEVKSNKGFNEVELIRLAKMGKQNLQGESF